MTGTLSSKYLVSIGSFHFTARWDYKSRIRNRSVQMLRQLIIESRETYEPGRTPDIRFAEKVLKAIESIFGKDTTEHFYRWATTVFYWAPSDQIHWSVWDDLIPRREARLPKVLPNFRQGLASC